MYFGNKWNEVWERGSWNLAPPTYTLKMLKVEVFLPLLLEVGGVIYFIKYFLCNMIHVGSSCNVLKKQAKGFFISVSSPLPLHYETEKVYSVKDSVQILTVISLCTEVWCCRSYL